MLVLTRRPGECVRIGPDVRVTVVASTAGQVRIAIDAPKEISIFREEIFERIASANVEAAGLIETVDPSLESVSGPELAKSGGEMI